MKTKKILAFALALVMALGLSVTAFAAAGSETKTSVPADKTIEVTGKYGDTAPATVFSVDIKWGAMEFTYSTGNSAKWNPGTHTYDVTAESTGWTNDGNEVTVTNHSNTDLDVAIKFDKVANADELGNYTGILTGDVDTNLAAAVEGSALDTAASATAALTFTGTLKADQTAFTKLGEITVTLRKE